MRSSFVSFFPCGESRGLGLWSSLVTLLRGVTRCRLLPSVAVYRRLAVGGRRSTQKNQFSTCPLAVYIKSATIVNRVSDPLKGKPTLVWEHMRPYGNVCDRVQPGRDSSVGRAVDWKSTCQRFKSASWHIQYINVLCTHHYWKTRVCVLASSWKWRTHQWVNLVGHGD